MKMNFVHMWFIELDISWMSAWQQTRPTHQHTHNVLAQSAGNSEHVGNTQMQQAQPRAIRHDRWQKTSTRSS